MKLKEKFATWNEDANGNEDSVAKLQTELFAMVGCNINDTEVEEPLFIYEPDPESPGTLLEVDGKLVPTKPRQKTGWVVLMDQDAESFNLFLDGEFKVHFGTSCRGATICFGEFPNGRELRAFVAGDGTITEPWTEVKAAA